MVSQRIVLDGISSGISFDLMADVLPRAPSRSLGPDEDSGAGLDPDRHFAPQLKGGS
jgi:hypothetical protein